MRECRQPPSWRAPPRANEKWRSAPPWSGRWRVIRQLLTESVLLSFIGGTLGLVLSNCLADLTYFLSPEELPGFKLCSSDYRVLAFTIGLTCLTGFLFGLVPALQASKMDVSGRSRKGGVAPGDSYHRNRIRSLLLFPK